MLTRLIASQLGNPRGLAGALVARFMNRSNAIMNRRAITLLDVAATHEVLDIGFGGGISLPQLLARASAGHVTGLERSAPMLAAAARRHATALEAGRLRLTEAPAEALPFPAAAFDRVLSVNVLYFWPDPLLVLREIRRVLTPSGILVLGYRPPEVLHRLRLTQQGFRPQEDEALLALLAAAGFETLGLERRSDDGLGYVCVVAGPIERGA